MPLPALAAAAPAAPTAAPGFMSALQGLTSNPQALTALLGNPMFTSGMGLLSASQNPNVDPYQAVLQGLSTSQSYNVGKEKRESAKQLKMDNKKLSEALAALIGQQSGGVKSAPGGVAGSTRGKVPGSNTAYAPPKFQSPLTQSMWDDLNWSGR